MFFGHDFGDSFEMDVTIWGDDAGVEHMRYFIARRIEENVAPGGEANATFYLPEPVRVEAVKVQVLCRVTGPNDDVNKEHPSYGEWRGNFDVQIVMIGKKEKS